MPVCHETTTALQPAGVLPYVSVANGDRMLKFLKDAFHATEVAVKRNATKHIVHATVSLPGIGQFEFNEAHKTHGKHDKSKVAPSSLYFFCKNAHRFYESAVKAGAKGHRSAASSVYHGHTRASVVDPEGNRWRFVEADHKAASPAKKAAASSATAHATVKKGKKAAPAKKAGKKAAKH